MKRIIIISLISLLTACTTLRHSHADEDGPPQRRVDVSKIPDAVPKVEPRSRYGNPPSYKVLGKQYQVMKTSTGYQKRGIASWYGTKFQHKRTSSGEPYNMFAMTAAHKTLPIPCYVRVTNLDNGRTVIVKVNDRGPFHDNRIIDLSYAAAKKLDIVSHGTGLVEIAVIDPANSTIHHAPPPKHPQLYLQVGAFSQRNNAEKLLQRIAKITQQAIHVREVNVNQTPIYRVQIGPLVGVGLSDKLHDSIKDAGMGDAIAIVGIDSPREYSKIIIH